MLKERHISTRVMSKFAKVGSMLVNVLLICSVTTHQLIVNFMKWRSVVNWIAKMMMTTAKYLLPQSPSKLGSAFLILYPRPSAG
jgi:hypothetical protein